MQSLELSCQESNFKLNDALNKIKGHHTNEATETTATLTTRSTSNPQHQSRHQTYNSIQNVQSVQNPLSIETNSTMTTHSTTAASVSSHSRPNNNNTNSTDRPTSTKQTSISTVSSSTHDGGGNSSESANATEKQSPSNTSTSGNTADSSFFDIHEKLRELYIYLYLKDIQDTPINSRIKLKSRSFVLQTLVARENLNTVILNLYAGNMGYSLAFRHENLPQNKKMEGLQTIFNLNLAKSQLSGATESTSANCVRQEKEEYLLETIRWPYDNGDLLEAVNNEELPILYMKLLLTYAPNAFYSGCVIFEVRDFRQSFPLSSCCDNYYVLLKPTTQTLLADIKVLSNEEDFTHEDRLALESNMVLATAEPLCLDPNPKVVRKAVYSQHKRQMWNTYAIRRQMRKFSQVAINRKRKTDQFTYTPGNELGEYLFKSRQRPRALLSNGFDSTMATAWKVPRKAAEVLEPIRAPNLDFPTTLTTPANLYVKAAKTRSDDDKDVTDHTPTLVEEFILETDRGDGRVYYVKLSIYKRSSNQEYLGELYVDRNYSAEKSKGEACKFVLGTKVSASRYIQQFMEIFTEEGRKSVKITHNVDGSVPTLCFAVASNESHPPPSLTTQQQQHVRQLQQQQQHLLQQEAKLRQLAQQQQTPQQQKLTQQKLRHLQKLQENNMMQVQQYKMQLQQQMQQIQQTQKPVTTPSTSKAQPPNNSSQKVAINMKSPPSPHGVPATPAATDVTGTSQSQPSHLKIANGSVVLMQDQTNRNISRVATITSQQGQNPSSPNIHQVKTKNPMPILAQISGKPATQNIQPTTGGSNEMNAVRQSPTHSIQNQAMAQANKSNSNAAIISLLNSAPAAMTSSAVVNSINTPSASPVAIPIQRIITHTPTKSTEAPPQKPKAKPQTVLLTAEQLASVRVSMSALASQLASPPALMSSSPINPATFNFAQLITQPAQQPQQIIINNNNKLRRDSLAAPSPGSDSNASSTSSSTVGNFSAPGFPYIGSASPTTSVISNECSSGSSERGPSTDKNILEVSMCGPSSVSSGSSTHFMTPSPKNTALATASPLGSPSHQHPPQAESPSAVNSTPAFQLRKPNIVTATPNDLSNANQNAQPQTTTLNLHGINFSSLQGAMATFPGLQNVQLQIPGLAQPLSLSLAGATNTVATANTQAGLQLESMPVSMGQPTQTVVLTTANQQGQGPVLSLPIAQIVTSSNVKNLNQQQIRNVNVKSQTPTNQPQQTLPHIQQQRPRSVPIATSPMNAKQLTARSLIASQRNIAVASNTTQMKITTPITMASVPHVTPANISGVNNNPMLVQLQLQKPPNQQFHHQNQNQHH